MDGTNIGGWVVAPGRPGRAAPTPAGPQPVVDQRGRPRSTPNERITLTPVPAGTKPPPRGKTPDSGNWYFPEVAGRPVEGGPFGAGGVWVPAPPGAPPPAPAAPGQPPAAPAVPLVDPAALAALAFRQIALDAPAAGTSPDPSVGAVVNLPTFLFAAPASVAPRSLSVSAGTVGVVVSAEATGITWSTGDGAEVFCPGPGLPWDPSYDLTPPPGACTHTYDWPSFDRPGGAYAVMATTHWHVTWTAFGAPGGGDLGVVPVSTSLALPVGEVQALLTKSATDPG